jgi:prephenate dehydratase
VISAFPTGHLGISLTGKHLLSKACPLIGIQGGKGSFNEQAASKHLPPLGFNQFQLSYLHTTNNVLAALYDDNRIDFGQFAIHNTLGGKVEESVQAMARYPVDILARYAIKVSHALMIAPDADLAEVDTVVTHPQVLLQCKATLKKKYRHLKLEVCGGDLVDPARVAERMGQARLPKNIGTISSSSLSEIHGLKVVDSNLQDADENYTTFLLVQRPGNNGNQ